MEPLSAAMTVAQMGVNALEGRWNRKHAEKMWWTQQKYNHPKMQMARLSEAGINPHLAFGKGSISNTATSQPVSKEISTKGPETLLAYANLENLQAQNDLIRANADKARTEANILRDTADYSVEQKRIETHVADLRRQQERFGVLNADPATKAIFQRLAEDLNKRVWSDKHQKMVKAKDAISDDQLSNYMIGLTLTKDLVSFLTKIGLGSLLGRGTKTIKSKGARPGTFRPYNHPNYKQR